MSRTILFLCPHNAAKSVLAAAYCQQLATAHGLDLAITSAGTEPDNQILPGVAQLLREKGLGFANYTPRRVTLEDLEGAFRIISLGCDVSDLAPPGTRVTYWNEAPPPSKHLAAASDIIYAHVKQLIEELLFVNNG